MIRFRTLFIVAVCLFSVAANAQSPVGKWKGSFVFDASKAKTKADKDKLKIAKSGVVGATVYVTFKADKTYTSTIRRPGPNPDVDMGKWSQKGLMITATSRFGGKEKMAISKDGKQIVMQMLAKFGPAVWVVLKRA